jgi:hypothetical protein
MQIDHPIQRVVVRPRQAREMLAIGKTKYFAMVKNGTIQTVQIGGTRMPTVAGIEKLLGAAFESDHRVARPGRPRKVAAGATAMLADTVAATTEAAPAEAI